MKTAALIDPAQRGAPAETRRDTRGEPSEAPPDTDVATLVAHIARQLGIDASAITIRHVETDGPAVAFAADGAIHLGGPRPDPSVAADRKRIAHEAAHIAQARLPGAIQARLADVRLPAEIEAESFARRYAETRTGAPVVVPLPAVVAREDDFKALTTSVGQSRKDEIAYIIDKLSYGLFDWAVTDGDISDVLRILDMFPMLTMRAIGAQIGPRYRQRFFGNLSTDHYAAYRPHILAMGWSAEAGDLEACDYALLANLSLDDLTPLEAVAIKDIVLLAPRTRDVADARKQKRIEDARRYAESDRGRTEYASGLTEARSEEAKLAEERKAREKAKETLAGSRIEQAAREIITGLDEIHVSDDEALAMLDKAAQACLLTRDPAERVRALVAFLGDKALDELIDQVPVKGLYKSQERRRMFVHLLSMRPAFKNLLVADELLDSPWYRFWDTVTSEEAYLAFLLVKSLPDRARAAAIKAFGGDTWTRIIDELPQNIRESADFNFYTGGEAQTDRETLLLALTDDALWDGKRPDRLDAMLRIARAAGESAFAFKQSEQHKAYTKASLKPLVAKYALFDPKERPEYAEKPLEGHAWYQEGLLGALGGAGRFLVLLFGLRNVRLSGGTMGADVDLASLHDYGGIPFGPSSANPMVRGARFRETSRAETEAAEKQGRIAQNRLRVAKHDRGELEAMADSLVIDRLSLAGETAFTSESVLCTGFRLSVSYTPDTNIPLLMQVGFDELSLSDCTVALRGSVMAINRMVLKGVRARLSNEALAQSEKNDGLGAMFSALISPKNATGVRLSLDLLQLLGMATSGGMFIDSLEVDSLLFSGGGNADAYLDALRSSESRLTARVKELEGRRLMAFGDEAAAYAAEIAHVQREIAKVRDEIAKGVDHGAVIDIKRIRLSGVPGVTDDALTLEDIHGQGKSVAGPIPLFSDSPALRNLIRGSSAGATIRGSDPTESFGIDIGTIESRKPLRIVGEIPTAAAAKDELEAFEAAYADKRGDAAIEPVTNALKERAQQAEELQALLDRGMHVLNDEQIERVRTLRVALRLFEERRAMVVDAVRVEGLSLQISDQGMPELAAQKLTLTGIRTFRADGVEAVGIASVEGENLRLKGELEGGLANYKEWRSKLTHGEASAGSLTIKDIRHAASGTSIDEISLQSDGDAKGLEILLDRDGQTGDSTVRLRTARATVSGIKAPAQAAALLQAEVDRIKAIPARERSAGEAERLETLDAMLADLKTIDEAEAAAEKALAEAGKGKAAAAAQARLDKARAARKAWGERLRLQKLTVDHLAIVASGLGDMFDPDYAFDSQAPHARISGEGKDGHWFEEISAEGLSVRTAKGDQTVAGKISVGPVGGEVARTDTGYAITNLTVGRLSASALAYQSGTMTVASRGESQIIGISVDATYDKGAGESVIAIKRLHIDRIVADQLHYEDESKVVDVTSGEIGGVTVSDMRVVMPEDPKAKTGIEGKISVDTVKKLTLGAVAGGYSVSGTVDAKARTPGASAISVDLAKSGERTVRLDGIDATLDVKEKALGNHIHIEWKALSGKLTQDGDKYKVERLSLGNLTLSAAVWKAGGKTIAIKDQVTLQNIALDAEASMRNKPRAKDARPLKEGEEPEKELASLFITRFTVDRIEASAVEVDLPMVAEDKAAGTDYSPHKLITLRKASITGLDVTGFDVMATKGKVTVKDKLSLDVRAVIGDAARHDLKSMNVSTTIHGEKSDPAGTGGRELSATLNGEDGMVVRLGRISDFTLSDLEAQGRSSSKAGTSDSLARMKSLSLANITTGDLIVTDTLVSISDIEIGGPVAIDGVDWTVTGAEPQQIGMASARVPDPMRIGKVEATFKKVATGKVKAGKEETRSELTGVTMTGLSIPKLTATAFHYRGALTAREGKRTVDMAIPSATILGIDVPLFSKDYEKNLTTINARIRETAATGFTATLVDTLGKQVATKRFGADIKTGEISANAILRTVGAGTDKEKTLIEGEGFTLNNLGLSNISGTLSETGKKDATIGPRPGPSEAPSADIGKIRYDGSGASVTGTTVRNVHYRDPNMGLTLTVDALKVPDTVSLPNEGPVTIPSGTITRAAFEIDDIMALGEGTDSGGGAKGEPIDTEQFYGILDHINGDAGVDVRFDVHLFELPVLGDRHLKQDVFPARLHIKNGKINYDEMFTEAVWARFRLFASLGMEADVIGYAPTPPNPYGAGPPTPIKDTKNSFLALNVTGKGNLVKWTPSDDAERREMTKDKEVRLKRLIQPELPPKDPNETEEPSDEAPIELRNLNANLGIAGQIPLDLGSLGRIALGAEGTDAATGLKLESTTVNVKKEGDTPSSTVTARWSIGSLAATIEELNLGSASIGGIDKARGAIIRVDGVEGGEIDFASGSILQPRRLKGTINKASVENLAITMGSE